MKKALFLFTVFLCAVAQAQQPSGYSSAAIYQGLKKLNVLGSVLYVAAHPDDENTRLLAYFSKDRLYRTGYLSLTRGDGGQNLIGEEQGVELGLIRTQELLAARRIDGAEQFFTRAYDFGYSKTPEETLGKWEKEKILADVVWVIRKFQPDVIITRFPTTGEGGHGHHTSSAILANEAFTAAADPKRFPEQLRFVQPWQARRILWNTFNFGSTNTTSSSQFHFDVGGYNPILGKSYGEIAAESRSQHKSQGFGVPAGRGEAFEYFRTTGGTQPSSDLFEDVVTDWRRVSQGASVSPLVENATRNFDFTAPEKSVPALVKVYQAIKKLPEGYWRNQKLAETQQLIEAASGLWMDAYTAQPQVAQGDSARISVLVNNRMGVNMKLSSVMLAGRDSVMNAVLQNNKNLSFTRPVLVSGNYPATEPYWLRQPMQEGSFVVSDQQLIGQPDVDAAFKALFHLEIEGENFVFEKPVRYRFTDPVKGEVYQPFVVLPKLEINYTDANYLSTNSRPVNVQVHVKSNTKDTGTYTFRHYFSDQWKADKAQFSFTTGANNSFNSSVFTPVKPGLNTVEKISLRSVATNNGSYESYLRQIKYDHIPWITYFPKAEANLLAADIKTAGKKIGYIVGAGDKVPDALEKMGYEVVMLTDKELSRNNLQQFDAIIAGVRAYNTNEWLNTFYDKIMTYVHNGGNLIVQYNTSNQIGPVKARIGPYDFSITRNRITDENAPVRLLVPDHPVLNHPNKITEADFKNWIQERSIYHAGNFKAPFQAILRMNDPGENPDDGSLIIAPYGKGFFTYTGLVFFRELPAGVPGAYRLLANLIALNQRKQM